MFRRHRHLPLILAATLLAGQWFAFAHESEHVLKPGTAHACATCIYAHGAGTGAVPASLRFDLFGVLEAPADLAPGGPLAAAIRQHPIRGPPALPV
jgi:hypothetical protein